MTNQECRAPWVGDACNRILFWFRDPRPPSPPCLNSGTRENQEIVQVSEPLGVGQIHGMRQVLTIIDLRPIC